MLYALNASKSKLGVFVSSGVIGVSETIGFIGFSETIGLIGLITLTDSVGSSFTSSLVSTSSTPISTPSEVSTESGLPEEPDALARSGEGGAGGGLT